MQRCMYQVCANALIGRCHKPSIATKDLLGVVQYGCVIRASRRTVRSCAEPRVQLVSAVGTPRALEVLAVDYVRVLSYAVVRPGPASMFFFDVLFL